MFIGPGSLGYRRVIPKNELYACHGRADKRCRWRTIQRPQMAMTPAATEVRVAREPTSVVLYARNDEMKEHKVSGSRRECCKQVEWYRAWK